MPHEFSFDLKRVAQLALYVIVRPSEYFRTMPRSGPLAEPLFFVAVLGLVSALISALVGMVVQGQSASLLEVFVIAPGLIIGAVFFGAAILFLLWKLLGSKQTYNVAFRATAASLAISPLTAVLAFVPYIGLVVNVVWTMYLLIVASVEAHGISRRKATIAFALLGLALASSAWMMQAAQVTLMQSLEQMGITPTEFSQMSSEEQREVLQRIQNQLSGPVTLD